MTNARITQKKGDFDVPCSMQAGNGRGKNSRTPNSSYAHRNGAKHE